MTIGIADTTVIIHLYRKRPDAIRWFATHSQRLAITSVTWLEIMYGARGKAGQQQCETIMNQFDTIYMTETDQKWAMQQMKSYRLSHGVSINDCLIASIVHRLQVPIYTDNVKDMEVMLPGSLVVKPY